MAAIARRRPDDVAVVDAEGRGRHTWRQVQHDSSVAAAALVGLGVGPGDVVSVQLPNRYETVVTDLAVSQVGAVINPLLPNYRSKELVHVVRTATPSVIFTPAVYRGFDHRELVDEVRRATGRSIVHVVVGPGSAASDLTLEGILAPGRPGPEAATPGPGRRPTPSPS